MAAPRLTIACCLCRKLIPQSDAHMLDAEWRRRHPQMVGLISCPRCAAGAAYYFECRTPDRRAPEGVYVPGHLPSARCPDCEDAWHHVQRYGTLRAMVYRDPWSAVQQGAVDWLRHMAQRPQLNEEARERIRDALTRWAEHTGQPELLPEPVRRRPLTFTAWLRGQVRKDGPVGDLARDWVAGAVPGVRRGHAPEAVRAELDDHAASPEVYEALDEAVRLWQARQG